MIKHINQQNFLTTPFVAVKSWNLTNLILDQEQTQSSELVLDSGDTIALEYIDYSSGVPVVNVASSITTDTQGQLLANFSEGISGSGIFYPDNESKNPDGTYKRLVYSQIKSTFYNQYQNPFDMFGLENIDIPLSQTNRYLANDFRVITIPQQTFGDKIVEGSILFYDTSLDDNVNIYDDSNGNLLAGKNIFSKIQELKSFGNSIVTGTVTSSYCSS